MHVVLTGTPNNGDGGVDGDNKDDGGAQDKHGDKNGDVVDGKEDEGVHGNDVYVCGATPEADAGILWAAIWNYAHKQFKWRVEPDIGDVFAIGDKRYYAAAEGCIYLCGVDVPKEYGRKITKEYDLDVHDSFWFDNTLMFVTGPYNLQRIVAVKDWVADEQIIADRVQRHALDKSRMEHEAMKNKHL